MKILKSMVCLGLAALLVMPIPVSAQTFSDVAPGVWYYDWVETAAQQGWLQGVGNGLYHPLNTMAYTEFVKMLTSVFYGGQADTCQVPEGSVWWLRHLETARELGLLEDTWFADVLEENHQEQEDPECGYDWVGAGVEHGISRYEMAQILFNLAKMENLPTGTGGTALPDQVKDWDSIPTRYRDAVSACYQMALLEGTESGNFEGDGVVSRAQGATILCRLHALVEKARQQDSDSVESSPEGASA